MKNRVGKKDDDRQLLEQVADSDPTALVSLYDRHVTAIYSYLYHRTHDQVVAEDLTAETFVRLFEQSQSAAVFTPQYRGYPVSAILYRIAHQIYGEWVKEQASREQQLGNSPVPRDQPGKSTTVNLTDLKRALDSLPTRDRNVLVLRYVEGEDPQAIARIIGEPTDSVQRLLHVAQSKLKKALELGRPSTGKP